MTERSGTATSAPAAATPSCSRLVLSILHIYALQWEPVPAAGQRNNKTMLVLTFLLSIWFSEVETTSSEQQVTAQHTRAQTCSPLHPEGGADHCSSLMESQRHQVQPASSQINDYPIKVSVGGNKHSNISLDEPEAKSQREQICPVVMC